MKRNVKTASMKHEDEASRLRARVRESQTRKIRTVIAEIEYLQEWATDRDTRCWLGVASVAMREAGRSW